MSTPAAGPTEQITARPLRSARYGWIAAGVVIVLFVVIAVVMPSANAGATFGPKDQIGTGVLGLLIAAGFWLLTRPRMQADTEAVRTRSYVGNYRTIPWSLIVDVQFPSNTRFARIVLPGDETLALYAVQRLDREQAVETMRGLRALLAATRGAA